MADIPSPGGYVKFNDVEINNEQPVTTALFYKIGENTNKLIDDIGTVQSSVAAANSIVTVSPQTFTWQYDSVSDKTFIIFATITKTRATPVQLYFPEYPYISQSATTGAFLFNEENDEYTLNSPQKVFSFVAFRSFVGLATPYSSTNISGIFSSSKVYGSSEFLTDYSDSIGVAFNTEVVGVPTNSDPTNIFTVNGTYDMFFNSGTYYYGFYIYRISPGTAFATGDLTSQVSSFKLTQTCYLREL